MQKQEKKRNTPKQLKKLQNVLIFVRINPRRIRDRRTETKLNYEKRLKSILMMTRNYKVVIRKSMVICNIIIISISLRLQMKQQMFFDHA